jgi:hypothetical protein
MAGRWARISDRIRFSPEILWGRQSLGFGPYRPLGVASGRWMSVGPLWMRLGSRSSWQAEDEEAEMIKPVVP